MKNKSTILLWTDAALLLMLLALAATGAVMHWVLPPGGGGRSGGGPVLYGGGGGDATGAGGGHAREWLDLTRHDWGDLHFWIAWGMVALIVFHLALHWGWIKTSLSRIVARALTRPHPPGLSRHRAPSPAERS